ncbi:MAG: FecR domain-containing protein [Candidatus Omnitrophota bacterium]
MKKMIFLAAVVLAVGILGMSGGLFAAVPGAVQAGSVASIQGEVKAITSSDPSPRFLKNGDPVFMGDKIETDAEGGLQIQLLDGTVFTLGSASAFTIDEFIYDPATDDGKVKAHMLQGMFRIVTGRVAHKKPENMVVNLPAGSMGFRGTDVIGIINGTRTEIILVGPVGTGRIYVTNLVNGQVVTVDIDQAGYATIVDGPNVAPVAIFQVSPEELAQAAQALGLPPLDAEGYTPPEIPDPTVVDATVQSEETSRDISPVQS